MSRYHPLAAPSFLGLPPLPTPPPDALGLLDAELLPESLPPPPRRSRLRQATSSDDEDDGAYPPVPPRVTAGVRPTRSDSRASDPRERNRSKAPGSEWESDDEPQARERPAGELVVLSRHPALVKQGVHTHARVLVAIRRGALNGEEDLAPEHMPLATRIGMRLLYHGIDRGRVANSRRAEEEFKRWSIREGRKFDDDKHAYERIQAFVRTYNIDCSQLREPDLRHYPTMNSFFTRRLARGARPPASPWDSTVISSAADCRLTVFSSVDEAKCLWIKGKHFALPALLQDRSLAAELRDGAVAIFRLAVEDYHRFHAPIDAVVGESRSVPGAYFTVNSTIVRDKRFDVFTSNKRDITTLLARHPLTGKALPVAYVQVGALLVASIRRTAKEGKALKRGDELGYFAYGGSTIVCVFPRGSVEWDEDLVRNSEGRNVEGVQVETLVKVGEKIGRWVDRHRDS
ncbi:phosphatidylserine decarboxylase-domain-containing protein [Rhodotorula diobovata]|uniref:Phosphatidylserine decarboxylase-domain-containing protein n=1 Tax=Rhodotorula diobovata TaxID=5288 RepID=A0A5C5FTC9_9BASI|nr:phosphatidylserine decarboxylase-domain-containing protein [Rhodotorula diobovata]